MADFLIRLFGWRATVFYSDPTSYSRYKWLKDHLKAGPLRTLDAGCGSGAFTLLASSLGNQALGVSDCDSDCDKARRRAALSKLDAEFQVVDLRQVDGRDIGSFDQIILTECIEHIIDDKKLVGDLAALLKPGGQLLLTTPYLHHKPYFEEWKMQTPGVECSAGHVRFGYTHEEIKAMFREAELETVCESYMGGFVSIQLTNLFLILSKLNVYVAWAVTLPFRILQLLDQPITRLLRYPCLTIGLVGRKA